MTAITENKTDKDIYNKLDDLRNNTHRHLFKIDALVKLAQEATVHGQNHIETDWCLVFEIIEQINKQAMEELDEIDALLTQIRRGVSNATKP